MGYKRRKKEREEQGKLSCSKREREGKKGKKGSYALIQRC